MAARTWVGSNEAMCMKDFCRPCREGDSFLSRSDIQIHIHIHIQRESPPLCLPLSLHTPLSLPPPLSLPVYLFSEIVLPICLFLEEIDRQRETCAYVCVCVYVYVYVQLCVCVCVCVCVRTCRLWCLHITYTHTVQWKVIHD